MKKTLSQESISVFFPCYNDKRTIGKLISDANEILKKLTIDYEIIVIDDFSTDGSRELLKEFSKKFRKLKVIYHHKNTGYGGALKTGFKTASKDLIFYTDGDGQYDLSDLPILFSLMTKNVDFVNGIKMVRHDPTYRVIIGNLYSLAIRWFFWLPIYDVDCDYRLIRKKIISKIKLTSNSGSICVELVKKSHKAGARFRQVSVHHFERKYGNSQFFKVSRIIPTFVELGQLWLKIYVSPRSIQKKFFDYLELFRNNYFGKFRYISSKSYEEK